MESVKKKYHDASEKVAEKYRQYQKLQVSIPAPLKVNTQSLHYIQIKDLYESTVDTELSITAFVHVIMWKQITRWSTRLPREAICIENETYRTFSGRKKKYNRHVASIAVLKYHITVYWQFMQMIE